jgi:hypothetical protein
VEVGGEVHQTSAGASNDRRVSQSALRRMVHEGSFPQPVRITTRNAGNVLDAVEA